MWQLQKPGHQPYKPGHKMCVRSSPPGDTGALEHNRQEVLAKVKKKGSTKMASTKNRNK